ncbi:hypothetical protein [Streptomyces flaveus]|uniref:Uncharacterized protein n=1 Tax=Streptomyces flaveus TaxID=66370 RepID=A0A917R7G7_9ACTN|nr:hypothetical protein [Streptomyces flaveus]GGK93183.1 hypothetical protein GCM10010094_62500 [Streptomyces flaveus]
MDEARARDVLAGAGLGQGGAELLAPGPIHGDALPRNVHVGPDGPVLFGTWPGCAHSGHVAVCGILMAATRGCGRL